MAEVTMSQDVGSRRSVEEQRQCAIPATDCNCPSAASARGGFREHPETLQNIVL